MYTVCLRSSDQFYIVAYYKEWSRPLGHAVEMKIDGILYVQEVVTHFIQ